MTETSIKTTQVVSRQSESSLFVHLVTGGVLTFGFYAGFQQVPWLMQNYGGYFIGHTVEYIATYLFFCGLSVLTAKVLSVISGKKVTSEIISDLQICKTQNLSQIEVFRRLQDIMNKMPSGKKQGALSQRVLHFINYMQTSGTTQGLTEHLQQHSNLAYDRYQRSYGFFNTAVWAIPILGFLGTVLGITIAIAHVTPEQLTSSLQEVTKGLSVAFDTTAQSLGLSFILVFSKLLVSSHEEKLLSEVDQTVIDLLLPHFVEESTSTPQNIHTQTSQEMFAASREMVNQHVAAWSQATSQLRQQWAEISNLQTTQFSQGLEQGLTSALHTHLAELRTTRDEYTKLMSGLYEESSRRIQRQEQQLIRQHTELMTQQQSFFSEMNQHLSQQIEHWKTETSLIQRDFKEMTQALATTSQLMVDLQDGQEQLSGLQVQLSQNLQLLKSNDTFEQTLETLNAAVHLLSARARNAA